MSKKIMKRSLALGALMAFIITGSALAEENPNNPKYDGVLDMMSDSRHDSSVTYETITVDHSDASPSNDMSLQAVVSKTANDALKATTSITINSRNSGICSDAIGSKIVVSAPTISINKVGYLSGIHVDRDNAQVIVEKFDAFSINATANGKYGWPEGNGIRINRPGAKVEVKGNVNSTINISGGQSGVVARSSEGGFITLSAGTVEITTLGHPDKDYKGHAISNTQGNSSINIFATKGITVTNELASSHKEQDLHAVYAASGTINIHTTDGATNKADVIINGNIKAKDNSRINLKLETKGSILNGAVKDENITDTKKGTNLLLSNGAIWNNDDPFRDSDGKSNVTHLTMQNGVVKQGDSAKTIEVGTLSGDGTFEVANGNPNQMVIKDKEVDSVLKVATRNKDVSLEDLTDVAVQSKDNKLLLAADFVEKTGGSIYEKESAAVNTDGSLGKIDKVVDTGNISANDMASVGLMSWRAEMNDMNKRMGELRNANGEHGVWVRMVRGENEYNSVKNQYNQYQLGYDEKLSVDKRWTVGVALSYTDAQNNFERGSGESTNKALAIYGSKLNKDGTFIDLIAKYARLENEFDMVGGMGSADYDTNGYSFSAEFGKRIQQGNGLWIEPQAELTYGKVSAVDYVTKNNINVAQDGMESLVGRVGFALGKDIKDGNVYARASYFYDFEGETQATLNNDAVLRQDLGGGWWEVGVGANINLSKATYVYADVEKTFGGEVDTNWQWNLGVRYSF